MVSIGKYGPVVPRPPRCAGPAFVRWAAFGPDRVERKSDLHGRRPSDQHFHVPHDRPAPADGADGLGVDAGPEAPEGFHGRGRYRPRVGQADRAGAHGFSPEVRSPSVCWSFFSSKSCPSW